MFKRKKTYKKLNDEALVERYYLTRDTAILGVLFERHIERILGLCLRYFKAPAIAEDVAMSVFEYVNGKLDNKPAIGSFKDWLYIVAKNYCIAETRKSAKNKALFSDWSTFFRAQLMQNEDKDTLYEREEQMEGILAALTQLTPLQRDCVSDKYLLGKSYKEIAEERGMTEGQVRSHIQNGKRNLKKLA